MHSRIFQIELSKEKIEEEGFIEESKYYEDHWFVGAIADYVSDIADEDRKDELNWLYSSLKQSFEDKVIIDEEKECFKFIKGFKEQYFNKRYTEFKERVEQLTFSNFLDGYKIYGISSLIKNKYGFYFDSSEFSLECQDDFIRESAEEDTIYYIGGIVDYHM